jgi:hypothetical protein
MKKTFLQLTVMLCLLPFVSAASSAAEKPVPISIAGISLGSEISAYPNIIDSNFMKEMVVTDWHGFRKGVIGYGVCLHKDTILKIDMKYEDKSKEFYNTLLKKIKVQYGDPDTWSGDSFGVKYIWKWHFTDKDNNAVILKLQHNSKDSNETIGNMIKLSYPDKIAEERRCFNEMCEQNMMKFDLSRQEELKNSDWPHLIPQAQE